MSVANGASTQRKSARRQTKKPQHQNPPLEVPLLDSSPPLTVARTRRKQHEKQMQKVDQPTPKPAKLTIKKVKQSKPQPQKLAAPSSSEAKQTLNKFFVSLISVFSAENKHQIVGRDAEEAAIKQAVESESPDQRLIYLCGHPGQGKTVVLNQVLHDHFSASDHFHLIQHNAMQFENLASYLRSLLSELRLLEDTKLRKRSRQPSPSKSLEQQQLVDLILDSVKKVTKHKKARLVIVIDEIDNFSREMGAHLNFKTFIEQICKCKGVKVVGIANSVELFRGEIRNQKIQTKAVKVIFDPYSREQMRTIAFYQIKRHFEQNWSFPLGCILAHVEEAAEAQEETPTHLLQLLKLVEPKALELCAARIDKLSGDLRSFFQILRNALSDKVATCASLDPETMKLAEMVQRFKLTISDVAKTCERMFESRINQVVKALPRSHRHMLHCIELWY